MGVQKNSKIDYYINDVDLYKSMRVDLIRSSVMGFILTIIFLVFINYLRNQDNGLHAQLFLISGLVGLAIILYKPGRPAQTARNTFGIPKELSEYEKKLEAVMLYLRKRNIVILATAPYFVWLLYLVYTGETSTKTDLTTLFLSGFFSFFMTLSLAAAVQYFQIWHSLGRENERAKK